MAGDGKGWEGTWKSERVREVGYIPANTFPLQRFNDLRLKDIFIVTVAQLSM